jgi:iron complex outermembrane receptor protein
MAQGELSDTNFIPEVIVIYQADKFTPITFQNINSKELKLRSTGQEPSFLLSETPSITNYSDAGNAQGYSYFRMRGIDQTRINITLDGVPLNEPEDQGAYFSNYPDILNSMGKLQIQRGVGTSKNGVASYGGSIQLFSASSVDSMTTTIGLTYGSFNSFRAFGEFNSGLKKNKSMYVRASEIYSDGYKYHSSNSARSVFMSGSLYTEKSTWKMNLLAGQQQNQLAWLGVADSLIAKDRKTNANVNEHDRFIQCLLQLQNSWRISSNSSLQSSVYYTFLNGNYDFNLNGFLGLPTTDELYNYAFQSNLTGFFSNYTISKKHLNWISGVHVNHYDRQHTGSELSAGQLYQNTGFKNEVSVFTKADYRIKRITLFSDVQYRYTSFDYKGSVVMERKHWQFINPKAGISVQIRDHGVLYYSIGNTGREPTRNDLFGGSDNLLADSVGNPLLFIQTPEHVTDHELGFRLQKKKLNLSSNLFYMNFRNEIVLNGKYGPNGLTLTDNVEKSFRAGIELSLTYKILKNLSLVNNSSFIISRIMEQDEMFTPILTPRLIINQEVIYSFGLCYLSLSGRFQDRSFIDFANTSTVSSYFLINSRIGWNNHRLEIIVFLNNITNAQYFNNGYIDFDGSKKLFVQAPTNTSVSIKYNF